MEMILMSAEDRRRLLLFGRVRSGDLSLEKVSGLLGLSYRQVRRIYAKFLEVGDAALVHGLRGKPSNFRPLAGEKERILSIYSAEYSDFGPTLAAEYLAKDHQLSIGVTTLRRWLVESGLWQRRRKRKLHRRRRPRRDQQGELVQMDGSLHDWFEGRRGPAVLMVLIDDATGHVDARFFENESWHSAAESFRRYVLRHGVPQGLYVDRHGIYRADRDPTLEELQDNRGAETQFGRSLRELGVKLILAHSPQAKGRVERMNQTLQDRLVKALRLANVSALEPANEFLERTFLPAFNPQFSVAAHNPTDGHVPLTSNVDLSRVLSVQENRVMQSDWTIRWNNAFLQLQRTAVNVVQPGQSVLVCEPLHGPLRLFRGDQELEWSENRTEPTPTRRKPQSNGPTGSNQGQKPRPNHPWRGRPR